MRTLRVQFLAMGARRGRLGGQIDVPEAHLLDAAVIDVPHASPSVAYPVPASLGEVFAEFTAIGGPVYLGVGSAPDPSVEPRWLVVPGRPRLLGVIGGQTIRAIHAEGADLASPGARPAYTLLSGAGSGLGSAVTDLIGGDYLWRVAGTWDGASATLQMLDLDGATWTSLRKADGSADLTLTSTGQVGVGIGQNATVRVAVVGGGGGTSLHANLAGL